MEEKANITKIAARAFLAMALILTAVNLHAHPLFATSVEETLKNLGLPPNPTEHNPGFLLWETDGKKTLPEVASDSHPTAYCMVPPELARLAAAGQKAAAKA